MKKASTLQERIVLLEDLHRPLEEHWSLKKKQKNLDPRNSEFIYKHHITRLEDIYAHQEPHLSLPPETKIAMTPVSQLYGVNGIKTIFSGDPEKKREKEDKWVDNFQKYHSLQEREDEERLRTQRLASSLAREQQKEREKERPMTASSSSVRRSQRSLSHPEEGSSSVPHVHIKKRSMNNNLSRQELIMLGMYKFTPQQEDIYNNFVQMLTEFDSHDMHNILEDALHDAHSDQLLEDYGGIDMNG